MRNRVTKNIVLNIIFLVKMDFRDICLTFKSLCHYPRASHTSLIKNKEVLLLKFKPKPKPKPKENSMKR